MKPKARIFVAADLSADGRVALSADQAHYLSNVLRLNTGDTVTVFNGRDGEWSAEIEDLARNKGVAAVGRRCRPQAAEAGPWLAFAPIKKTETDFLVEKATELGAARLCPVFTRRTNAARVNLKRLRAHAMEASEQCGRLTVPDIAEPMALDRLPEEWPGDRRLLVLDETGGGRPIADVLSKLRNGASGGPAGVGFLSGPEGGFEVDELDTLRGLDFVTAVGLGPRVLRAETAALSAMACWQAILGPGR